MKRTMQASEIAYELFVKGDAESEAELEQERQKLKLVAALRDLRERAGLTHGQLAKTIGTSTAAIAKLEDPDDDSHSLEVLHRAISALGMALEFKIVKKLIERDHAEWLCRRKVDRESKGTCMELLK